MVGMNEEVTSWQGGTMKRVIAGTNDALASLRGTKQSTHAFVRIIEQEIASRLAMTLLILRESLLVVTQIPPSSR